MTEYGTAFNKAVAAELRAERARKEITLDGLVAATDIAKSTVQRYLGGKRDIPIPSLIDLCRALDIDPRIIFERAEKSIK